MSRIRHQLFYAGLLVAIAAVYSALAPLNVVTHLQARLAAHRRRPRRAR